jgi:hypothetical protein
MLKVNTVLKKLIIKLSCTGDNKYILSLIEAFKINKSLEELKLNRPHVLDRKTLDALSQLPQFNSTLKKISLYSYERYLEPGDSPFKELINPTWSLQEVKAIMRNKYGNTFFQYLPNEIINIIEEYIEYDAEKLFPRFE